MPCAAGVLSGDGTAVTYVGSTPSGSGIYRSGIAEGGDIFVRTPASGLVTALEPVMREGEIYSSTRIREALRAGWASEASDLLGHHWEIEGAVVGSKFYVMAGLSPATGRPMGMVYVFDASTNAWTTRSPMPVPSPSA